MLYEATPAAFAAWAQERIGHAEPLHRAVHRAFLLGGATAVESVPELTYAARRSPGLADRYRELLRGHDALPTVVRRSEVTDEGVGTTTKLALAVDGGEVESVLIPMGGPDARSTICVSSQLGCRMGCTFCHTAKMGLVRSLTTPEIIGQVVAAWRATGIRPRNLVFMGMGEPGDNLAAVAQAVRVLTDPGAFAMRGEHVTVSTVGRIDALEQWSRHGLDRVNLAVSLTAADDAVRSALMPVNRTAPLAELRRALLALPLRPGRRILFGCVVIPGVTDAPGQVAALVDWLRGLPALVNLIPYNPIPSQTWRAPTDDEVLAVRDALLAQGIPVRVRLTKGASAMAACGQLGTPRPRRPVPAHA